MKDVILHELKCVVEEAVRPVRATMARKRRIREELLAHLVAILEQEVAKLGDEPAAIEQAKRRFGDSRELATQLQQAVPRWNRCRAILENLGYRPDESAWHLAAKHFLVMLTIYSVPLLWLSLMLAFGKLPKMGSMESQRILVPAFALAVPILAGFNVVLSVVFAPLLCKVGAILASRRWGRISLAMLCGVVLLCGFHPGFTGAAVLFLLMARQAVKQWHYQADWA